jgi:prephenate dehydratase
MSRRPGRSSAPALPAVAYQGEPGAFGEEAVIGYFGDGVVAPMPVASFAAVCHAVESGSAVGGVLPLENSVAGTVGDALDALLRGRLRVIGEALVPIRHQLLAAPNGSLARIRGVASHWQALAQCDRFLSAHRWRQVSAADTAGAARELAADPDPSLAVIASERAAERYGLAVLARDIQDDPHNVTRFAVLGPPRGPRRPGHRELPPAGGLLAPSAEAPRNAMIVFETAHVPGALHRALGAFADAGVNLSRIESRPAGGARWRYRFLVQVDGDPRREPLRSGLVALRQRARSVRVLGSFPAGS